MIRINLLPVREIKAKVGRKQEALGGSVCLGLALLIAVAVYAYQARQISNLEVELAELQQEMTQLNAKVREVGELQKRVAELKEKNEIIETLNNKRTGPVQVMESLSGATPARLWLTEFKETGGTVTINGFATDNQTIADFLKTLAGMPNFKNVELLESMQTEDSAAVKKFIIKSNVSYQVPAPAAAGKVESAASPAKPSTP
ncbi:MAG: PilN domain-containing protein [Candidatus Binatia bacterium]